LDVPLAMNSLPVLGIDTGTALAQAIALAYEPAEDDVMRRKPRDSKKDRLASLRLLLYSYAQIGMIEFLVSFLGFLLVFKYHNVPMKNLIWASNHWSTSAHPLTLTNGKTLTSSQQVEILGQAQALYWFLVVVCQIMHVYLVRTRTQSVWTHGFFGNMVLNYGVVVEICICIMIVFVPDLSNSVMGFNHNLPKKLWALFILGWGVLYCYIEGFKWAKRHNKGGAFVKMLGF